MTKDYLSYHLTMKKHQIQTELDKCKIELGFMEKQLKDITDSIKIYWGFLLGPIVLMIVCTKLGVLYFRGGNAILSGIFLGSLVVLAYLWVILGPYSIYQLVKYNLFKKQQEKCKASIIAPPSVRNPIEVLNKPSQQTLYTGCKMTEWKVFRYTHYLEEIDKQLKYLKDTSDETAINEPDLKEIEEKLNSYDLYVDINAAYQLPKTQTRILKAICIVCITVAIIYACAVFYNVLLLLRR